jgi:SDR family mycofactocin-dependent oxidoreductase
MAGLEGKVALITGAARGQGRAHAVRMAELGADIIALDICQQIDSVVYPMATAEDLAETARLVERLDRRVVARQGDVRDRSALDSIAAEGVAELGRLDIVVANAGIMALIGEQARTPQAWNDAVAVMLTGVYNTVEACLPAILAGGTGGSIVLTSSTAGLKGMGRSRHDLTAGMLGYTAAKHGVVGLMHLYSNGLAPDNIRVNSVHPTGVSSPMIVNDAFGAWISAPENAGMAQGMQNTLPVELLEPRDIAYAVAWLCTEEARYITGVALPVDAGFTTR